MIIIRAARTGMSHEHTTPHLTLTTQDIIWQEVEKTQTSASKEPMGLSRIDGMRADGVTPTPWSRAKPLAWAITVTDTYAASHIQATSTSSGAIADKSAKKKTTKYCNLTASHLFIPIAIETSSIWCSKSAQFIEELGKWITAITNEPLKTTYLFQSLSVTLQRGNAFTFHNTILESSIST